MFQEMKIQQKIQKNKYDVPEWVGPILDWALKESLI